MRSITYLLGLLVVILAVYSYDVRMQQQDLEVALRNNYTNDLAEATGQLKELQRAVSLSLAFKDEAAAGEQLDNVVRLSGDLRHSISQLPLSSETTNEWLVYLKSLSNVAAGARNSADWQQDGHKYEKTLNNLQEEWIVATSNYFENNANLKQWQDETLHQTAFQQVQQNLTTANKEDFPITASESDYRKKQSLAYLEGEEWTKQQVLNRFHELFPGFEEAVINISVNKDDSPYPFYHVRFAWGAQVGYADFTKKGGHLISFLIERPNNNNMISHEHARKSAENFLEDLHLNDVTFIEARENHKAWHFVFSRVQDGLIIYPDTLQIKVAKDDGQIVGASLSEYIKKEQVKVGELLNLNAEDFFTEDIAVEEERLVITESNHFELVPCYEWIVRTVNDNSQTFKVLVNASNKEVVEIDALN